MAIENPSLTICKPTAWVANLMKTRQDPWRTRRIQIDDKEDCPLTAERLTEWPQICRTFLLFSSASGQSTLSWGLHPINPDKTPGDSKQLSEYGRLSRRKPIRLKVGHRLQDIDTVVCGPCEFGPVVTPFQAGIRRRYRDTNASKDACNACFLSVVTVRYVVTRLNSEWA